MKNYLSSMPLWPITIGLIVGISLGITIRIPIWWPIIFVIIAAVYQLANRSVVSIWLAAIAVGLLDISCRDTVSFPTEMDAVSAYYSGTVESIKEGETSRRIVVSVKGCGVDSCNILPCRRFKAALFIGSMLPQMQVGDNIRMQASFTHPIHESDLPYEYDYTRDLHNKGIEVTSFVSSSDVMVCGKNGDVKYQLLRTRGRLSDLLFRSSLSPDAAYFVNAVLLGDTSHLADGLRAMFSAAGIAHLLALSGMHVAIIAMLIAIVLFPFSLLYGNGFRYVITILLLWVYAIITGSAPSVVRAVIMATIMLGGRMLHRDSSPLNNLCLAAIVILLFDPMALVAPGFQLSFTAVLAIFVISPTINRVNHRRHPYLYKVISWAAVCLAAVIGTGMLSAYYFHTYPLYFLIGNFVAMLMMPFVMGCAMMLLIIEAIGCDPIWLCNIVNNMYDLIVWSADMTTSFAGSTIRGLYFSAWALIPYYITVVMLILAVMRMRVIYVFGVLVGTVVLVMSVYVTSPVFPESEYFITRNAYRTDIIIRQGHDAYLMTTAPKCDVDGVVDECMNRYGEYFGRVGVTRIDVMPDTCSLNNIARKAALLSICNDTYIILKRGTILPTINNKVKYALVCRGYCGNIADLYAVADTVLLSRDIDNRRHDRYVEQLCHDMIPYRSLRNHGFRRILHQDLNSCSYPFLK